MAQPNQQQQQQQQIANIEYNIPRGVAYSRILQYATRVDYDSSNDMMGGSSNDLKFFYHQLPIQQRAQLRSFAVQQLLQSIRQIYAMSPQLNALAKRTLMLAMDLSKPGAQLLDQINSEQLVLLNGLSRLYCSVRDGLTPAQHESVSSMFSQMLDFYRGINQKQYSSIVSLAEDVSSLPKAQMDQKGLFIIARAIRELTPPQQSNYKQQLARWSTFLSTELSLTQRAQLNELNRILRQGWQSLTSGQYALLAAMGPKLLEFIHLFQQLPESQITMLSINIRSHESVTQFVQFSARLTRKQQIAFVQLLPQLIFYQS